MTDAQIIALAETKMGKHCPRVQGYTWINKPRKDRKGGGVALLIRDDIIHLIKPIEETECSDQEICWAKLKSGRNDVYVGVFYGPQENSSNEEAQTQYANISTQVNKFKSKGHVILMGDFNAKLEIENINQRQTRNGKYLQRTIEDTGTIVVSLQATKGIWTRVNRKKINERSVIDYIIMTEEIAQATRTIHIDEEGIFRLKGKEETDHNTILIETSIPIYSKITKETILNLNDPDGWKEFNKVLANRFQTKPPENYDQYDNIIKKTLNKAFKKITITKGQYKYKLSEKGKKLKDERKRAKREFQKADKDGKNNKLEAYIKAQKNLRIELEYQEKERVEQRIERIIREGGAGSNHFWKIRKKILKQGQTDDHDLITEEGKQIKEPEKSKEYIANYYENLYRAREGTDEYKTWTDHIKNTVHTIENKELEEEPEFTKEEMKNTIKSLKRGKGRGPDGIPNEVFIESDSVTSEIHRNMMNCILSTSSIPEQWKDGNLKRIYKGKGVKGKCSNERGITLASNVGKVFERLINNRVTQRIELSDAQAGGTKNRATTDHILILKEMANITKTRKKQLILVYLDVTKAYDKAWLDGIMYVLQKRGIKTKLWKIIKELNSNLTTSIKTKHGKTRKINITDSIRQGGVLSVTLYALMMDETNKALKQTDLGIKIPGNDTKIPCLLWMDDVVLLEETQEKTQNALKITNHTSLKYHIEYGMPKTKYLTIGGKNKEMNLKLGNQQIQETEKYTYLGEINNRKMNLKDQIESISRKTEVAYQTLMAITGDREFKGIRMASIWRLISTCIIPIITYASETWNITKSERKKLNQELDKILKRILMTPYSTPREALYMETGLLDVETIADSKRLNMKARLNRNKSELMEKVLKHPGCQWEQENRKVMEKYRINNEDLEGTKYVTKNKIRKKILIGFKNRVCETSNNKSKMKYYSDSKNEWTPGYRAKYMNELNRKQVSLVFKARTRMIKIRGNYKNGNSDLTCRACKIHMETQDHVLETCPQIHRTDETKITKSMLFSENPDTLRKVAANLEKIIGKLE